MLRPFFNCCCGCFFLFVRYFDVRYWKDSHRSSHCLLVQQNKPETILRKHRVAGYSQGQGSRAGSTASPLLWAIKQICGRCCRCRFGNNDFACKNSYSFELTARTACYRFFKAPVMLELLSNGNGKSQAEIINSRFV